MSNDIREPTEAELVADFNKRFGIRIKAVVEEAFGQIVMEQNGSHLLYLFQILGDSAQQVKNVISQSEFRTPEEMKQHWV